MLLLLCFYQNVLSANSSDKSIIADSYSSPGGLNFYSGHSYSKQNESFLLGTNMTLMLINFGGEYQLNQLAHQHDFRYYAGVGALSLLQIQHGWGRNGNSWRLRSELPILKTPFNKTEKVELLRRSTFTLNFSIERFNNDIDKMNHYGIGFGIKFF